MCGNGHHFSHSQIWSQCIILVNVGGNIAETSRIAWSALSVHGDFSGNASFTEISIIFNLIHTI